MRNEFAIYSKRTLTPDGLKEATVFISEGKISRIENGRVSTEVPLEDVEDLVLMPG